METILAWQGLVALSIIISRIFSKKAMIVVACCWTVFTFLAVFAHWLVALQLGSAWGTVWLITTLFGRQDSNKVDLKEVKTLSMATAPHRVTPEQTEPVKLLRVSERKEQSFGISPVHRSAEYKTAEAKKHVFQINEGTLFRSEFDREKARIKIRNRSSARLAESIAGLQKKLDDNPNLAEIYEALEKGEDVADILKRRVKLLQGKAPLLGTNSSSPEGSHEGEARKNFLPTPTRGMFRVTIPKQVPEPTPPATEKAHEVIPREDPRTTPSELPTEQTTFEDQHRSVTDPTREQGVRDALNASNTSVVSIIAPKVERREIEAFAHELRIPHLVHFTRCENLPSIFRHGLMSVRASAEKNLTPERNDLNRWDAQLDGTSLSITFPNYRMFWKYRQLTPGSDWAVLLISPQVLWKKECAFYRHNAADARMIRKPRSQMQSAQALRDMFSQGEEGREDWLQPYDPTDPQAEIMVYEMIEPSFIEAVAFETYEARNRHRHRLQGRECFYAGKGRGLFAARKFVRTN